jgi:hypothetical protein
MYYPRLLEYLQRVTGNVKHRGWTEGPVINQIHRLFATTVLQVVVDPRRLAPMTRDFVYLYKHVWSI